MYKNIERILNKTKNIETPCDDINKLLQKSVITENFEQLSRIPVYKSERATRRERKQERMKTKGNKWFDIPAKSHTDDVRKDLEVLQMRSILDPKRFYKRNDIKTLPKYFQVGEVVDSPLDYYNGRIPKKERKPTIVEELMIDKQLKEYSKKKFNDVLSKDAKVRRKIKRKMKMLKKKRR